MKLIDLSHLIETTPLTTSGYASSEKSRHMPTPSPSIPQPKIKAWQSHYDSQRSGIYSQSISREISLVEFVANLGTIINSPYEFLEDMYAVDQILLEQCVLPGVVIDCTAFVGMCYQNTPDAIEQRSHLPHWQTEIGPEVLSQVNNKEDLKGKAVLLYTGYDKHWKTDVYARYCPFVGRALTEELVNLGVKLVGIDCLSVDSSTDPGHFCYNHLLRNEVLVVENLCKVNQLVESITQDGGKTKDFVFHAAPAKFQGASAFPVRAYAVIL